MTAWREAAVASGLVMTVAAAASATWTAYGGEMAVTAVGTMTAEAMAKCQVGGAASQAAQAAPATTAAVAMAMTAASERTAAESAAAAGA